MIQIESFQEFRAGLAYLRGGDAHKALPHLRSALDQEPSNPFYISYLGVAIAAAEQKWAEAEKMCHSAMRMNRRQAQLYLNLAEVYVAADRKHDAADILARLGDRLALRRDDADRRGGRRRLLRRRGRHGCQQCRENADKNRCEATHVDFAFSPAVQHGIATVRFRFNTRICEAGQAR